MRGTGIKRGGERGRREEERGTRRRTGKGGRKRERERVREEDTKRSKDTEEQILTNRLTDKSISKEARETYARSHTPFHVDAARISIPHFVSLPPPPRPLSFSPPAYPSPHKYFATPGAGASPSQDGRRRNRRRRLERSPCEH